MPTYVLNVNGEALTVNAPADMPLLWVLRDLLGVTGPKYGCGVGICGACTSHVGGAAVRPCIVPVGSVGAQPVTTIEGLANGAVLHPVQQAWVDEDVAQCGFCQPGQIMAAVAKVRQCREEGREVDEAAIEEIRNICRCGTYQRIREAIVAGAENM